MHPSVTVTLENKNQEDGLVDPPASNSGGGQGNPPGKCLPGSDKLGGRGGLQLDGARDRGCLPVGSVGKGAVPSIGLLPGFELAQTPQPEIDHVGVSFLLAIEGNAHTPALAVVGQPEAVGDIFSHLEIAREIFTHRKAIGEVQGSRQTDGLTSAVKSLEIQAEAVMPPSPLG